MNADHQNEDTNVSLLSLEIDKKGSALQDRIASLRQKSQHLIAWDIVQPGSPSSPPTTGVPVIDPWDYLSVAATAPEPDPENVQERKSLRKIMRGLSDIEKDITVTLPTLSSITPEKNNRSWQILPIRRRIGKR